MPLCNRVAPDGSLHAVAARGMFTGNRGIIHDPATKTLTGRRWSNKSWIACTCQWKATRRAVFGKNAASGGAGWSELFFLDEVTALAAGHRPCFFCRRMEAKAFAEACAGTGLTKAKQFDQRLHGERRLSSILAPRHFGFDELPVLPDGTIVQAATLFLALKQRHALPWSFTGYGAPVELGQLANQAITLVTPGLVLVALASGYQPAWHQSAVKPGRIG